MRQGEVHENAVLGSNMGVEWMRCPTVAFQILPCVYTGLAFGKAVPVRAGLSVWVT